MTSKYVMMMVGAGMIGLGAIATANEGTATPQKQEKGNSEKMVQRARAGQGNEKFREARQELMTLVKSYNQAKNEDKDLEKSAKILEEIKVNIAKTQELRTKEGEKPNEKMKAKQAENSAKLLKAIEEGNFPPKIDRERKNERKGKNAPNKANKAEKANKADKANKAEDAE